MMTACRHSDLTETLCFVKLGDVCGIGPPVAVVQETTMPDLPSHPDTGSSGGLGPDLGSGSGGRARWKTIVGIVVVVVVLVVFVVLHLTGVLGPGEH
jgi:hypothetical protein